MSKGWGLASQFVSQRQAARCQRWLSDSSTGVRINRYTAINSRFIGPTVASSQLLRYAVSGDTKNSTKLTASELDEELELVFSLRHSNKEGNHLLSSLPGSQPPPSPALHTTTSLYDLELWFEQFSIDGFRPRLSKEDLRTALLNCEKSHSSLEILSVLGGIISRTHPYRTENLLQGVGLSRAKGHYLKRNYLLHFFGLYYASQSFSPSTFRYHLNAMHCGLKANEAKDVIMCLLHTLRTIRLANPDYDTRSMLKLVAMEDSKTASSERCLMDLLPNHSEIHPSLVEVLLEFGAAESHKVLWDALLDGIVRGELSDDPRVDGAYRCILVFLKAGKTDYAALYMDEMMKRVGDIPPSSDVSSKLSTCLNEHGLTVPEFIKTQASQAENSFQGYDLASTDNLQLNGGTVHFSIVESLLSQIRQHGISVSASEIAMVIDALNDCEGSAIPLFTQSVEGRTSEFAWAPRWIPVVSNLESASLTQTLGLLRAQIITRKILISSERGRNLIQLGHLVQRELTSTESGEFVREDWPASSWRKTGYLVAFDRISAEYLVIYMGDSFHLIDPEYREEESGSFEQHSVFGSLSSLAMPTNAQDLTRDIADVVLPVQNAAKRYFIDLDPGDSLQP